MNKADALCEQMFSVPFGKLKKKKRDWFQERTSRVVLNISNF